jgi:hypothetical protein
MSHMTYYVNIYIPEVKLSFNRQDVNTSAKFIDSEGQDYQ